MLSQVGSVTTNGIQQKSDFRELRRSSAFADMPVWPNLLRAERRCRPARSRSFTGVRVFDRDYQNPRIISVNVGFEQRARARLGRLRGLHLREGRAPDALPELQRPRHGAPRPPSRPTRDTTTYTGANPFEPQLGDVFVTNSRGHGPLPRR